MNGTCFQDPIGFIKFSISPEFVPLLMDKDLLHKIFVSLRGVKQELYANSCFTPRNDTKIFKKKKNLQELYARRLGRVMAE